MLATKRSLEVLRAKLSTFKSKRKRKRRSKWKEEDRNPYDGPMTTSRNQRTCPLLESGRTHRAASVEPSLLTRSETLDLATDQRVSRFSFTLDVSLSVHHELNLFGEERE